MSTTSTVTNPVTFNGSSTFSSSFQQVLQRAVSIASLPMQQMQNAVNDFQSQQAALSSLQATFASLQNSIQDIASAATGNVSATSSNSSVAVATSTGATLPGVYSLEVDNIGSATTTISSAGTTPVTDPGSVNISSSSSYKLTVNGVETDFTLTSNSLQSLATAINDSSAGVQATIVNLGSNASPDYRLSVTSNNLGPDTIQLNDGANDLLTNLQSGSLAEYKVNGNTATLTSNSDQITLAPGLTATLVSSAAGQTVNITVAASESALSTALSNFATAYNSAVDAMSQQRGQSGGALAGESVVYSLSEMLSQVSQFATGSGSVQSLTDLGVNLDSTGHLSFDSTKFDSQSASAIQQFLGSTTSGGFLQAANDALTSVADPTSGILAMQFTDIGNEITNENNQITDEQSRIDDLQANLQAQLSAADAAIAVLQQQKTYYADMFAAEYLTNSNGTSSGGSI